MASKSELTKSQILREAEREFSEKGFFGARVDEIARHASVNKALIYAYFGSKKELYKTVLFDVYDRLRLVEQEIIADDSSDYREKLRKFVERYYRFLQQNPTYVRMVMWENLNHAEYFIEGEVYTTKDPILCALERIYEDASKDHKVLDSIDPKQLMITLIGVSFNYFSNNDTLSQIVREDLMDEDAVNRRIRSVTDMLLAYIEARG